MKYIQVRHMDYWYNVYDIGPFRKEGAGEIEFSITEDKEGKNLFFHFDFYNLPVIDNMMKNEDFEFMKKQDSDYNDFIQRYHSLKNGELEYFIAAIYYKDHYPTLQECELNGHCIFDLKSPTAKPYYADLFLSENEPLVPEKMMEWVDKISIDFFKQIVEYEIVDFISKEDAQKHYDINEY